MSKKVSESILHARISPVTTVRIYSKPFWSHFLYAIALRITQPFDCFYLCTFQISQNILWMIEDKAWSFLTALTLSHIDGFITRITGYHISKWVHKSTNWHFGLCAYRALFSKVSRLITFFLALQFFHLMFVFNHVHEGSIFRNQEILKYN